MITRWRVLWQSNRRLFIVMVTGAGVLIIAVLVIVYSLATRHSLDNIPIRGTATEVYKLSELTKNLTDNSEGVKSGKITHIYLEHLRAIRQSCQRISIYLEIEQKADTSNNASDLLRLNQSKDLCQDLARLASNSESIYRATEPLLSASTKPRRYQALGLFANQIRERHLNAASMAIKKLENHKNIEAEFPSTVIAEIKQLQSSIKNSKGLAYMPVLNGFQLRVLAERQQYWGPYAGAQSLQKSLEIQFTNYCQSLQKVSATLKQCADSKT